MSSNISILIIEDDYAIRQSTINKLKSLGYFKLYEAANSTETLQILDEAKPTIALVDIGLKDSDLDGIELAKEIIKTRNVSIIFTTAFSDKATLERSNEVSHSNYLTKPVNDRQLHVAIQRALMDAPKKIRSSISPSGMCPLYSKNDSIFVKGKNAFYHQVFLKDVLYLKAELGGTNIITVENKHFTYTSLTSILEASKYPEFVRIHRSVAVNKGMVIAKSDQVVRMTNGEELDISRSYRSKLDHAFTMVKPY